MNFSSPALSPEETKLCANAHAELHRAVLCASDLFGANIKCLAHITRMQKEFDEQRMQHRTECEVLTKRIESLMSIVEAQQYRIDALHKVSALGDIWGSLADIFDETFVARDSGHAELCKTAIDRCCAVMAWISINCFKCASFNDGNKLQCTEAVKSEFQLGAFAHEIALLLSKADVALKSRENENIVLINRVKELESHLYNLRNRACSHRLFAERTAMTYEDDLGSLSRQNQVLKCESIQSKRLEERVSLLSRQLDDATRDGEDWKLQCSTISTSFNDLVTSLSASNLSLHTRPSLSIPRCRIGSENAHFPQIIPGWADSLFTTDVASFALSLKPNFGKENETEERITRSGNYHTTGFANVKNIKHDVSHQRVEDNKYCQTPDHPVGRRNLDWNGHLSKARPIISSPQPPQITSVNMRISVNKDNEVSSSNISTPRGKSQTELIPSTTSHLHFPHYLSPITIPPNV